MQIKNYLFLISFFIGSLQAENKIIYIFTNPRSCSTLLMRTFEGRNDTTLFSEPFAGPYFSIPNSKYKTFKDVKKEVKKALKQGHVVIKGMTFEDIYFLKQENQFLIKNDVYFFFLIRDPHHSTISFAKKAIATGYNPERPIHHLGYDATYKMFTLLKEKAKHQPKIIFTKDFYTNPEKVLRAICDVAEIDYQPSMIELKDLGDGFNGNLWNEQKSKGCFHHWHDRALHSTKIEKPKLDYTVDEKGNPKFSEIEEQYRNHWKAVYKYHLPFYHKFLKEKDYFLL